MAFYNGFIPNFTRLGLWTCVCFVSMEKIKAMLVHEPPKKE